MKTTAIDPRFRVTLLAQTPDPQRIVWAGMHQDYSEDFVADDFLRGMVPSETTCGEIAVKRLLQGNRGHYGCYSADTLVMTAAGWKAWPDVAQDDQLLAVNIETGEGHFERPKALYSQPLRSGDFLYSMSSQRLDQLVTHDHRMIVSRQTKSNEWSEFSACPTYEIAGKAVRYRVTTELAESDRRLPVDRPRDCDFLSVLRIAGFYYGDEVRSMSQSPRCLRFRLRKQRKIDYLQEHGSSIGRVATMASDRYTLRCGPVAEWVERHFKASTGKTIPSWLIRLPRPEFLAFLDGLRHSDGTRFKANTAQGGPSWAVDSCEKAALETIQAAAVLNGIACSLTLNHPNQGPGHASHRSCWRLHFSHDRPYARFEVGQSGRTRGEEGVSPYEGNVYCATVSTGALLVSRNGKTVVSGNCLEHPAITLNVGWFPHSVMQQARTHRVGISFDVQSGRYTGSRIIRVALDDLPVEEVFYFRPVGFYTDRNGAKYEYTEQSRNADITLCKHLAEVYHSKIQDGFAEEHARDLIPYAIRQHFVVSFNLRSVLHFMDLRSKLDAQDEIRALCELIWPHIKDWAPQIAEWYEQNRLHKARLAP
jgi:thymidylate synthase (FAD)